MRRREQRDAFDARLRRIAADAAGPSTRTRRSRSLLSMPFGLLLGAVAMIGGRAVSFHLFTGDAPYAIAMGGVQSARLADFAVAALLCVPATILAGLETAARCAILAGAVIVMVAEARLVALAPDAFARIFSESRAVEALARTAALS